MLLPRRCAAGRQRPGHRYADGSTPVHHPPAPYWSCRPTPADSGRLYRRSRETRRQREYRAAAAAPPARSPPAFCHCRQRSGYQPPPPAPARARLLPPQLIAEANHPAHRAIQPRAAAAGATAAIPGPDARDHSPNCILCSWAYTPLCSSRSWCVPRSTIRPSSTTTISSACSMVDRR